MYPPCRLYSKKYPEDGDFVIGDVTDADLAYGAKANLVEYPGLSGMAILKELSRRRIRNLRKVIQVGQIEVFEVHEVNEEKNYIDLSKRNIQPQEKEQALQRYAEAKRVLNIVTQACHEINGIRFDQEARPDPESLKVLPINILEEFLWTLPVSPMKYFRELVKSDDSPTNPPIPEKWACLEKYIRKAVSKPIYRLNQKVDLVCYQPNGVNQIREILMSVVGIQPEVAKSEVDLGLQVSIESPPSYNLHCQLDDPEAGKRLIQDAISQIKGKLQPGIQFKISGELEVTEV